MLGPSASDLSTPSIRRTCGGRIQGDPVKRISVLLLGALLRDARPCRALGVAPALCMALAPVLVTSGCGGGGASTKAAAPVTAHVSSAPQPAVAPNPRLSILSPRMGAHTSPTLTVRVALDGAPSGGARRFRYVLDRRLARLGSARLTFHDLAPGHHRLEVFLVTDGASRAATAFTVRAPAPVVVPAPVQTTSTSTSPTPAPPTTTAVPPPPPTTSVPSRSSEGIPQGGGGDGDGDNSGGPSDGDGNI
jgi:hypothetical protein